jgi:hypothetical protein
MLVQFHDCVSMKLKQAWSKHIIQILKILLVKLDESLKKDK